VTYFNPCPKPLPQVPEPKVQKTARPKVDPVLEAWKVHIKSKAGDVCEMKGLHHKCWGELDAPHVIGKGAHPRLKVDPENGVALCRTAHNGVHRSRWFKVLFGVWFNEKYPGRRERLEKKAQREARLG
jgi:hypothetical protein